MGGCRESVSITLPKDRSFDVFSRWFDIEHHSMLMDLCGEPLIRELQGQNAGGDDGSYVIDSKAGWRFGEAQDSPCTRSCFTWMRRRHVN